MKAVEPVAERQGRAPLLRGRLFRKYFALILALVCGALVISGGTGLYFSYQENKASLAALQQEKAVTAATHIEQFVRRIEQQLAFAAPQLGGEALEQRRLELIKLQRFAKDVTDVAEIDGTGRERLFESRLAMSRTGSGNDRSQEPAFREAQPGQPWFGPVYFRKETEPYMAVGLRSGGPQGPVLIADVNLKFMWDVVTRIKVGQRGKAYVVDRNGYLIADPDIGLVLRKTDLSRLEQVKTALAVGGDERAMVARDSNGKAVLTAWAPVEPLGWQVFVEQPASEVFQALDASIVRNVALIAAGLVFSALAALWLARSMTRPIGVLQEGAQRIGAGELEHEIDVHTGDELEALAGQFNRMTAQLRESYAGLERKVEERTGELQVALERQTATAEVLGVISGSPTNVQPVFEAILEKAVRLCDAELGGLFLRDGELWTMASYKGDDPRAQAAFQAIRAGPHTAFGRLAETRRPVHIADLLADADTAKRDPLRVATIEKLGARTFFAVPLVKEQTVIGAVVIYRREVRPFAEAQIRLVTTFADQAVIAIENVRLFNETKEALEQQTATSEILKVISGSTTHTQPVFEAIVQSGRKLFPDAGVAVVLADGEEVRLAAIAAQSPERARAWQGRFPFPLTTQYVHSLAILERRMIDLPDAQAYTDGPLLPGVRNFLASGSRAMTIMPMIRGEAAIGAISVVRDVAGPLSYKQVALLRTFADQAVIAIENVRLFNETKEALERQTAISEVLRTISSTPSDVKPTLDAVAARAARLCDAMAASIYVLEGDVLRRTAFHGPPNFAGGDSLPYKTQMLTGRAVLEGKAIHVHDIGRERDNFPMSWELAQRYGHHTMLAVPLTREGRAFGTMFLRRAEVRPFSDKQIALAATFADQAAIAIQNVRLFREIEDKSRQLEVANKHKSEFLANMSHELRTPLNAIIGFSEVLMDRMFGELNEKQADYLKDIHESGRHLLSLINDILDLSKIEAGRMELELSAFHLPTALANAMTLVRERAQRHGIKLGLEVDPRLGEWRADERKFKQIVLNLLSNAVKFTPDGGRVDVLAKLDTTKVEIAVRDTGIGIAPEDQQAVFEEFKQVGRDYTRKAEGTGLGLALSRKFVELHGGEIRLESAPGKGSTFTFTLPVPP